jgi:hypothetical protein
LEEARQMLESGDLPIEAIVTWHRRNTGAVSG